jgi:hypothetical protein
MGTIALPVPSSSSRRVFVVVGGGGGEYCNVDGDDDNGDGLGNEGGAHARRAGSSQLSQVLHQPARNELDDRGYTTI